MHGHISFRLHRELLLSVVLNLLRILLQDGCLCNLFLLGIHEEGYLFFYIISQNLNLTKIPAALMDAVISMNQDVK